MRSHTCARPGKSRARDGIVAVDIEAGSEFTGDELSRGIEWGGLYPRGYGGLACYACVRVRGVRTMARDLPKHSLATELPHSDEAAQIVRLLTQPAKMHAFVV